MSLVIFSSKVGMTTLTIDSAALRATSVTVTDEALSVELIDGRSLSVPLGWYPRLRHGTTAERDHCEFIGEGRGIHWPDLDEDISVEGLIAGRPSGESASSFKRWLEFRVKFPAPATRPLQSILPAPG